MKKLIVLVLAMVALGGVAGGEDQFSTSAASALTLTMPANNHYFSIDTETGQLYIDGTAVERFSDPELRAAMKDIAESMLMSQKNNQLVKIYDDQTTYLLKKLDKCIKLNDDLYNISMRGLDKIEKILKAK